MFAFELWVSNGGIPIKSIHPELSPLVKARCLSDNHMWSNAQRSIGFILHYHFNNCATDLYNADPYYTVQYSLCLWIGNWQQSLFIYSPARRGTKDKSDELFLIFVGFILLIYQSRMFRMERPVQTNLKDYWTNFLPITFKASQSDVFTASITSWQQHDVRTIWWQTEICCSS